MKRELLKLVGILLGAGVVFLAVIGVLKAVISNHPDDSKPSEDTTASTSQPAVPEPAPAPAKIDFQPMVDDWVKSASGESGILIYDLDNDALLASHNETDVFRTASLYKLFVTYEGYLKRENGKIDGQSTLVGKYTWDDCLDLAIRESNSTCGEAMLAKFRDTINTTIKTWGIKKTDVPGLTTTPEDMLEMLKIYYKHDDLSGTTWDAIRDSMLNQPPSAGLCSGPCNWRQGLPSGFSDSVNVLNKVGWEHSGSGQLWNLYHDTAIVEIKGHHYIVILMTTHSYLKDIRAFAEKFEQTVTE